MPAWTLWSYGHNTTNISWRKTVKQEFATIHAGRPLHLMKRLAFFCLLCALSTPDLSYAQSSVELLDEMMARKARRSTAVFPLTMLEDGNNNYIWQPETFMYHDLTTGAEVWKITNTNNLSNFYHNDIGVSPWSADGKRLGFVSSRRTQAYAQDSSRIWMIQDTNGSFMRATTGASGRGYSSSRAYMHWSPQIPDLYYEFGQSGGDGIALNNYDLYKNEVSDTAITKTLILRLPPGQKTIDKMISGDGRKLLASPSDESLIYPITVYPVPSLDLPNGYTISRNLAPYGDTFTPYSSAHDRYYAGDGRWYFILASGGSHSWWRLRVLGTASDGGCLCNNADYPVTDKKYDFGECWPENAVFGNPPDPSPLSPQYWSHFVPDRWGRFALYSASDSNPLGPGTYNMQSHGYTVETFGGGAQHHDWHGFADWTVSTSAPGANQMIHAQKYNTPGSQIVVNSTYSQFNGGTAYETLTRPGQSPDGTKVAWHSEFLNGVPNAVDLFWAVVYYPFSPTNLSATYSAGVKLEWLPPKYTDRGWPYAQPNPAQDSRGWPVLDSNGNENGEPLYAREIKRYHIWRSLTGTDGWQEVGAVAPEYSHTYSEDPTLFMLHPIVNGLKVSATNKIAFTDAPGDGTFYYAITSEEHSALESNELSEILHVIVSGNTITTKIFQPKGQRNFWQTPPQAPQNASYKRLPTAGHYKLSWSEPADTKIRYYNIYYSKAGAPQATRQYRIASLPVGTKPYLDWLADPSVPGFYGLTAVDRYGNESAILFPVEDTAAPAAPIGLVVR